MAIKRIYCAVDFSAGASRALATAVRLAREREAELVVFHAWELPAHTLSSEFMYPDAVVQQLGENAQHGLDAARREAIRSEERRVGKECAR